MIENRVYPTLVLLIFLAITPLAWGAHPSEVQHILVLNSYHQGFKWSDEVIDGIRLSLQSSIENVNIHIEQMDTKRYPNQDLEQLARVYATKYKNLPLSAIITADDNAFNFIKSYRLKISSKAPLIFCGVNFLTQDKLAGLDNFSGINEAADLRDTLDLILQLHPQTKRIVAITDLTTTGGINRRKIDSFKPFYSEKIEIEQWYDLSHAELLEKLSGLRAGDIVLLTSFFRDRLGQSFEFDEIAKEVSSTSPVPVYGGWDYNLGYGIVGGKLASGFAQGSAAGQYAVSIIQGEAVSDLPIKWKSPNHYMFDAVVLERFHINQEDLPAGAIIINHIPSPFELHKTKILSALAVFVFLLGMIGYLLLNIRRRIHAERKLQDSQAHYRDLTELLPQTVFEIDEQGRITYFNQSGLSWSGYSLAELSEAPVVFDYFHPDDRGKLQANIMRIQIGGSSQGNGYRFIKKDGSSVSVLTYSRHFKHGDGSSGVRGVLVDISDIHRAEQAALAVRLYLQNVVDLLPTILIGVDAQGFITLWNQQAEKATGIPPEKAHGELMMELLPALKEEQGEVEQTIAMKQLHTACRVKRNLDGEDRFWDILIYPLTLQGIDSAILYISDVTEQMRVEQVMVQTEKMMTVGGLAAGMAHELNNPLAAIMQNAQVILRRIAPDQPKNDEVAEQYDIPFNQVTQYLDHRQIPKMLHSIMNAGHRAADIIQEMLNFSRSEDVGKSTNDINGLIDLAIDFAKKDHRKYNFNKINIQKNYDDIPPLICSATQIQQVLLNIIKNAAEAMAVWQEMDRPQRLDIWTSHADDQIRIVIKDNGPGMPESVRSRIFEPFYTTKPEGVGSGLGLSISYYIISQNHNGSIRVTSTLKQGTNFTITLPVHQECKLSASQPR